MSENKVHHAIDYIEISVTDVAQAKDFYREAFGWEFTDYGPDYAGIRKSGGGESGGFARVDAVQGGGPLVVLYSDDLNESLERVKLCGGQILEGPFSFPGGSRFNFADPFGNTLAVWTPE